VSTANAFYLRRARLVFVDIRPDTLNIDERLIEAAVTERTKVVVPVHYAGVGCAMDEIDDICRRHGISIVEDAAQGVNALYHDRYLGTIGDLGCYSFHETKNVISGEGGALLVNKPRFEERAEVIREKGTNRSKFYRGEVDKYTWVDIGSSYLPSDLLAAFLFAQLEQMDTITRRRTELYDRYRDGLSPLCSSGCLKIPTRPASCTPNCHLFYVLLADERTRNGLMAYLRARDIHALFHYVPLHLSPVGLSMGYREGQFPVTESVHARLLRLPMYYEMTRDDHDRVISSIHDFFRGHSG
jgi:dTDP-4-amino-4,6-dideoxygalactose transaminase